MRWLFVLVVMVMGLVPGVATSQPRLKVEARLLQPVNAARLSLRACVDQALGAMSWQTASGSAADIVRMSRSSGRAVERRGERLLTPDWAANECLQLEIDLQRIARRDRWGLGARAGHFLRLSPATWLWRPRSIDSASKIRFEQPSGWSVTAPWPADAQGWRSLGNTPADWPATVAWFRGEERVIDLPSGRLRLAVLPTVDAPPADLEAWMRRSAATLQRSVPTWPRADTQVLLVPLPGVSSPVPWGQVTRGGAAAVQLFLGNEASARARTEDWTASHEFAHLLHPFMGDRGRWLAEGLASYYQNVARARSGELSAGLAWEKLLAGFDRGRKGTPANASSLAEVSRQRTRGSTMRVYWSGAAFWLQTDLALRDVGSSLDQALSDFAQHHLPSERLWHPADFVSALVELQDAADPAGLRQRYRHYAQRRDFPALAELLGSESSSAKTLEPRVEQLLRQSAAESLRSELLGPAAAGSGSGPTPMGQGRVAPCQSDQAQSELGPLQQPDILLTPQR